MPPLVDAEKHPIAVHYHASRGVFVLNTLIVDVREFFMLFARACPPGLSGERVFLGTARYAGGRLLQAPCTDFECGQQHLLFATGAKIGSVPQLKDERFDAGTMKLLIPCYDPMMEIRHESCRSIRPAPGP